jgi:hypothetical protein
VNIDALLLALLGIADIGLVVYLRRRHTIRVRRERIMASLCMAVRRANGIGDFPARRPLRRAS